MRYLTSGESHGPKLDAILDGFPSNFCIDVKRIDDDLHKRQFKLGSGSRQSIEQDHVIVNSGIMNGKTTGSPLSFSILNKNHGSWIGKSVSAFTIPRPGHADKAGVFKYNLDDIRDVLERTSARGTAIQVVVGSCCLQLLEHIGIHVKTKITSIGPNEFGFDGSDENIKILEEEIEQWRQSGETIGGKLKSTISGLIPGIGSYSQFDQKLDAKLASAVMSIPAMKAVEFGAGFQLAKMYGTQAQRFLGGITGGLSTGEEIEITMAMKPIPTTIAPQDSIDLATMKKAHTIYERSDICPIFRTPIIVDSALAYVVLDELIKMLGGDTFEELKQRFEMRKKQFMNNEYNVNNEKKVFWR